MIPFIFDFTICILHHVIIYRFWSSTELVKRIDRFRACLSVFTAALILAIANQWHIGLLNFFVFFCTASMMTLVIFCDKKHRLIITSFFLVIIASGIEAVMLPIVSALLDEKIDIAQKSSEFQFMFSLINQLAFFILAQLILTMHISKNRARNAPVHLLLLPIISIIVGATMLHLESQIIDPPNSSYMVIALSCLGLLVVDLIIFVENSRSVERYEWKAKYNSLEQHNEAQSDYYSRLQNHLESIRIERHDFREKLEIISQMALRHSDELKEYIQATRSTLEDRNQELEINIKNPAINIILHEKATICAHLGITFDYTFEYLDMSFIDTSDTIAIFVNSLNNAIEACNRIVDTNVKKFITLQVKRIQNLVFITVENSKVNRVNMGQRWYLSGKENAERHGYGIASIEKAAADYDGAVVVDYDENSFTISIRLRINEGSAV